MNIKDITEKQKEIIHFRLVGTIKFDWEVVNEVLKIENAEELFNDETEVMDLCDLEYCEICEWIMSREECGNHPILNFVCHQCEDKNEDI